MQILKLFFLVCLLTLLSPVMAHSSLVLSEPADGAELSETPQKITLEFNRKVRLVKLGLLDENEEKVKLDFKPSPDKNTVFEVAAPELESGNYQVQWLAMSADSHKIKGEFGFTLNLSSPTGETKNTAVAETQDEEDEEPDCE